MPTIVVITIIVQNTRPIPLHIANPPSLQGTVNVSWVPNMPKMKNTMKSRKPKVRTNAGIGLWGEYFDSSRSYRFGGEHRTNHTDECDESDDRIKPPDDDIGDDNPIEIQSWSRKVAMELFFLILCSHNPYLFLNSVQSYEEYNRQTNLFVYLCIGFIYH